MINPGSVCILPNYTEHDQSWTSLYPTSWHRKGPIQNLTVSYQMTSYMNNLDQPVSYLVTHGSWPIMAYIISSDTAHGQSLPTPSVLLIFVALSLFLCAFLFPLLAMVRHTTQHSKDTFLIFSVLYSTSCYTGGVRYSDSYIVDLYNICTS